jgi:hypothetical protein
MPFAGPTLPCGLSFLGLAVFTLPANQDALWRVVLLGLLVCCRLAIYRKAAFLSLTFLIANSLRYIVYDTGKATHPNNLEKTY